MADERPDLRKYPNTPQGFHQWAQDVKAWNGRHGISSEDLIREWNKERKNA
jgi:hypothetical protein